MGDKVFERLQPTPIIKKLKIFDWHSIELELLPSKNRLPKYKTSDNTAQ